MNTTASKVPCSVSLLTLNAEADIGACLEQFKDFAEIIVCDGNSTDRTQAIAKQFGATIVCQYDTDEPNVPCVMDKAAVRQKAMDASTQPWRFFMDADDALAPEALEEMQRIVTAPNPRHLIYRMPSCIFIDGKEVLHEATYPAYQPRLVHESVGARFKNPVHDHLVWDEKKFPVGTMHSKYYFHWPKERMADYWSYLRNYVQWEVQVQDVSSFKFMPKWIYQRLRTIAGYLLWRLPRMYLQHGFRNSMPLSVELTIVRYHVALLFGIVAKYIRTRLWYEILIGTLRGKDLNRILQNVMLRPFEAYGRVLDIGGGKEASYWRYLQTRRWHRKTVLDIDPGVKPDIVIDLERDDIPRADGYFDTALLCNVLEHIRERPLVLSRIRRVLKDGGELIGIVPFLVGVHPDPHDYARMTAEELRALLLEAGFRDVRVEPVGRGPLLASYNQSEFLWPRLVKLVMIPAVLAVDTIILKLRPEWRDKFPLSYVFVAR